MDSFWYSFQFPKCYQLVSKFALRLSELKVFVSMTQTSNLHCLNECGFRFYYDHPISYGVPLVFSMVEQREKSEQAFCKFAMYNFMLFHYSETILET